MAFGLKFLTVKKLTWSLGIIALLSIAGIAHQWNRLNQINDFNEAVTTAQPPNTDKLSYEAKYAQAYWLAKKEYYKESTKLFTGLTQTSTPSNRAAVFHNIGNMFFLKALRIDSGSDPRARDEAEYLLTEAKTAYKNAVKLDNSNWGTRRNLDRVLSLLPEVPTPGVSDSDSPGMIMGNIPVGLP
jgi:mxaK protein